MATVIYSAIYSATASLDGFIAGPDGDMSWLSEHLGGENEAADRLLARLGAPAGAEFATDLVTAVERAKVLAGDRDVNVLGADVAAQCLAAGLLDEVLVFFVPVLLGDGTPLFRRPDGERVRLERVPGETEHWYRVVR
jgi:dihydrofolate reductase